MNAIIYIAMSLFDLAIIAGTVYLIDQRGWSAWMLLLMMLIIAGSNPTKFVSKGKTVQGVTE